MSKKNAFHTFIRTILLTLAAAFCVCPAEAKWKKKVPNRIYADQKPWHWGFSVGTHVQDLGFTHNGFVSDDGQQWQVEVPSFSPGFNATMLGDLRLHRYFNLRLSPGMYFGSKTVNMLDVNSGEKMTQDVKSALVTIPLDLKISGDRLHNTRPYATAGIMGVLAISKKRSEPIMTKNFDTMLTVGLGCDFYMPFFKFCPEIKFCFGLTDILKHDRPDLDEDPKSMHVTQSIQKMKSNMVVLSFYFE